jgi:hypothetical protein
MRKVLLGLSILFLLSISFAQGFDFVKDFLDPYLFWIVLVFFASVVGGMVYASTRTYREEIAPFLGLFAGGAVALAIYVYRDSMPFLFGADVLGIAIIAFLAIAAIAVVGLSGGISGDILSSLWLVLIIGGLLLVIVGSAFFPPLSIIGVLLIFLGAIWGLIKLLMSIGDSGVGGGLGGERAPRRRLLDRLRRSPTQAPGARPATTEAAGTENLVWKNTSIQNNQIIGPKRGIKADFNKPITKRSAILSIGVMDVKGTKVPTKKKRSIDRKSVITYPAKGYTWPSGWTWFFLRGGAFGIIAKDGSYLPRASTKRPSYFIRFRASGTTSFKWYKDFWTELRNHLKVWKKYIDSLKIAKDENLRAIHPQILAEYNKSVRRFNSIPKPTAARFTVSKEKVKRLKKRMKQIIKEYDEYEKIARKARKGAIRKTEWAKVKKILSSSKKIQKIEKYWNEVDTTIKQGEKVAKEKTGVSAGAPPATRKQTPPITGTFAKKWKAGKTPQALPTQRSVLTPRRPGGLVTPRKQRGAITPRKQGALSMLKTQTPPIQRKATSLSGLKAQPLQIKSSQPPKRVAKKKKLKKKKATRRGGGI